MAMTTFDRLVLRRIAGPFTLAILIMLMALVLERLLRLVRMVNDRGVAVTEVIEMLGYLIPHYLGLALPAALFIAVMIEYRRLHAGNELTVMMAVGTSIRRLARPALGLAAVMLPVMLILVGFAQPHARYAYRDKLHAITEAQNEIRLQPGVFQEIGESLVLRADRVSRDGSILDGFFARHTNQKGNRTTLIAERAHLAYDANSGAPILHLFDGAMVRPADRGPARSNVFGEMVWRPPVEIGVPRGPRGQDERELTIVELVRFDSGTHRPEIPAAAAEAELHARLVQALSLPMLVLLAVPLALVGRGRVGRAYGIPVGLALLVLYEKLAGVAEASASKGVGLGWPAIWAVLCLFIVFGELMIAHASESAGKPFGGRAWRWLRGYPASSRPTAG